jgi:hypothetical protein
MECCRKGNREEWRGKREVKRVAMSDRIEEKS